MDKFDEEYEIEWLEVRLTGATKPLAKQNVYIFTSYDNDNRDEKGRHIQ